MPDDLLEERKDALIRRMTEVYASGEMEMAAFESAVTRLNASRDLAVLAAEASALGMALDAPVAAPAVPTGTAVELSCVSGTVRKGGAWVKSPLYRLSLRSSTARLDLGEYADARGFRLTIAVEAQSSSLVLMVPRGFEVEERFSERVSSSVRNKPRGEACCDNLVVLVGSLKSSVVRVKYLK